MVVKIVEVKCCQESTDMGQRVKALEALAKGLQVEDE